ncbi:heavy-metal-associated domain-containing protein [Corynebacterium choanae]|uniref:Copper chaperone CopZ n=1 Tax=Corynebacterium choanae TaxID=1862358 RepID=A0A3G6J7S3_9CORY|nr:heavy metal-associated domain-containing protein [Corynebacterium choanae]AZA12490.1 Copper chaperone CopZ [Corynebacterium choanae]
MSLVFDVPAMTCQHCVDSITSEVSAVDGVTGVQVDLDTKKVTVDGDGLSTEPIVAAIDEAGFDATVAS